MTRHPYRTRRALALGTPAVALLLVSARAAAARDDRQVTLDLRPIAATVGYTSCDSSDCLPGLFGGAYASAFHGWRRRKVGALLEVGRATKPPRPGATVVNVSPVILRLTF